MCEQTCGIALAFYVGASHAVRASRRGGAIWVAEGRRSTRGGAFLFRKIASIAGFSMLGAVLLLAMPSLALAQRGGRGGMGGGMGMGMGMSRPMGMPMGMPMGVRPIG